MLTRIMAVMFTVIITVCFINTFQAGANARAVSLSDATYPPTYLRYVYPHRSVTRTRQCGRDGYWSNVSAYKWDGSALGAQQWDRRNLRYQWRSLYGRVTFDGITFTNSTRYPVLVAGWCDS